MVLTGTHGKCFNHRTISLAPCLSGEANTQHWGFSQGQSEGEYAEGRRFDPHDPLSSTKVETSLWQTQSPVSCVLTVLWSVPESNPLCPFQIVLDHYSLERTCLLCWFCFDEVFLGLLCKVCAFFEPHGSLPLWAREAGICCWERPIYTNTEVSFIQVEFVTEYSISLNF